MGRTCRKNTAARIVRRTTHDVRGCALHTESHGGRPGGDDYHPKNFDWAEREHRQPFLVLECEAYEQDDRLPDVASEEVQGEGLDVVERAPALLDGSDDRREIVVSQNYV